MSARCVIVLIMAAASTIAGAGIDRGGITRGIIQSIEPFIVGDTEFDISQALVQADGVTRSVAELAPGQIASVTSHANGAVVADSIAVDASLRSRIDIVAPDRLIIAGQTVLIDHKTAIETPPGGQQSDLIVTGQRVNVNGFHLPDGSQYATRIQLATLADDKITGEAIMVFGQLMRVGGMWIDFTTAKLGGFSAAPRAGDTVEAFGQRCSEGLFCATALRLRSAANYGTPNAEADLEGYVTRFESIDDFEVDGLRIQTDEATEYVGGDQTGLNAGVFVVVDGMRAGNVVVAERIQFIAPAQNDSDSDSE